MNKQKISQMDKQKCEFQDSCSGIKKTIKKRKNRIKNLNIFIYIQYTCVYKVTCLTHRRTGKYLKFFSSFAIK